MELLPSRLSRMCAHVLGADGAGLSVLNSDLRVPLGASDGAATAIERLQFTTGQGPCWQALQDAAPVTAAAAEIARRWPLFSRELQRHGTFHSLASVPLHLSRGVTGALDLYFVSPAGALGFDPDVGAAIATEIALILNDVARSGASTPSDDPAASDLYGPRWAAGPTASARIAVWIAAGMLMHAGATADDAVARLRAAAIAAGRSTDDVAADLISKRMTVDQLLQ